MQQYDTDEEKDSQKSFLTMKNCHFNNKTLSFYW